MKELIRILSRLSDAEKRAFRLYLNQHQVRSLNKKELLMDQLLRYGNCNVDDIRQSMTPPVSKQALYQLKKRLKDDLVTFMLASHHKPAVNCHSERRWNSYRMLNYFHVLIEHKLWQDAHKLLDELEDQARSAHISEIVLLVQTLRNQYFPLSPLMHEKTTTSKLICDTFKAIRMSQRQNEYLQAQFGLHDKINGNPSDFTEDTKNLNFKTGPLTCYDNMASLFIQQEYIKAYRLAYRMLMNQPFFLNQSGKISRGILFLYLSKVALAIKSFSKADNWLKKAENDLRGLYCWELHSMELRFYVDLRRNQLQSLPSLCCKAHKTMETTSLKALTYRWQLFEAFLAYKKKNFSRVIQLANQRADYPIPPDWSFALSLLELLSIRQMQDTDWLFYKMDSLRKKAAAHFSGQHRFICVLKRIGQDTSRSAHTDPFTDDYLYPEEGFFHPIGPEVINFFSLLQSEDTPKKQPLHLIR